MWLAIPTKHGRHIVPKDDLVAHENSSKCICGPKVDSFVDKNGIVAWQYLHESLDRREDRE